MKNKPTNWSRIHSGAELAQAADESEATRRGGGGRRLAAGRGGEVEPVVVVVSDRRRDVEFPDTKLGATMLLNDI